ncbi:hypothetical protein HYDPIDRAFT_132255 [Hydnomerulius pinastri MD-312]|uniref:Uncharacterized protein n=1 Tax=Hydnomerulius pinastri MD-312 TaxID=994086 RepID=A0A0C9WF18_9AGAM|nr:hypothetical protein HYDPIDRAFT_132255 [Hydnomerulius pinastri MD-312]
MPNPQMIHTGDPAYASPVIRAPSPASSVGTAYGPDETAQSDSELSQEAFEQKWSAKLKLDGPKIEEELKSFSALIQPLPQNPAEEKMFFEVILRGLRSRIQHLEEEEVFQQTLRRGSQVGVGLNPSDGNIDSLMRTMMGTSLSSNQQVSDGPWNRSSKREVSNDSFNYEDTVVKGKQKM